MKNINVTIRANLKPALLAACLALQAGGSVMASASIHQENSTIPSRPSETTVQQTNSKTGSSPDLFWLGRRR
jgi:hypothetical protein